MNYFETNHQLNRITCKDGFSFSVQGGAGHYSKPRANVAGLKYKALEIGFPSAQDGLIQKYAESPKKPTDTVYGWVPVKIIAKLIIKHGGLQLEHWAEDARLRLFDHHSPFLAIWKLIK